MFRSALCLFLLCVLFSCGGGSSPEPIPPVVIPPPTVVVTTPIYGLFNMVLPSNETRTILFDKKRSYIFSIAKNELPVSELMCVSEEQLQEFSETLTAQTLNFVCSGSSIQDISITINFDDNVSIKYIHDTEFDYELSLDDITKISTPNFRNLSSSDYLTPVRDDINISRYIVASPRIPTYIDFAIFSRDWPIGGNCLASMMFRITDLPSLIINETNEYASIPYVQSPITPPSSGCSQKVLPMPSSLEDLDTYIYTLEDGSFFIAFEQQYFITMGRFFLSE